MQFLLSVKLMTLFSHLVLVRHVTLYAVLKNRIFLSPKQRMIQALKLYSLMLPF